MKWFFYVTVMLSFSLFFNLTSAQSEDDKALFCCKEIKQIREAVTSLNKEFSEIKILNSYLKSFAKETSTINWEEVPIVSCNQAHGGTLSLLEQFVRYDAPEDKYTLIRLYSGECYAKGQCGQPADKSSGQIWAWVDFKLENGKVNFIEQPKVSSDSNYLAARGRGVGAVRGLLMSCDNKTLPFLQ